MDRRQFITGACASVSAISLPTVCGAAKVAPLADQVLANRMKRYIQCEIGNAAWNCSGLSNADLDQYRAELEESLTPEDFRDLPEWDPSNEYDEWVLMSLEERPD